MSCSNWRALLQGYTLFSTYQKDDLYSISYLTDRKGQLTAFKDAAHRLLEDSYGFDPAQKPVWSNGCLEPHFAPSLMSGEFVLAPRNVLLAGDAAGFHPPATLEGIGPGMRSGLLAAESLHEAFDGNQKAEGIYLHKLEPLIQLCKAAIGYEEEMAEALEAGDIERG